MSKWTKWIEHTGDINQKWDSEEDIKIKLVSGAVVRGIIESLVGLGPFTHYKRLKTNVEAEKEAALQDLAQLGQECDATPQPNQALKDLYNTGKAKKEAGALATGLPISMVYKNYRGEISTRSITPISVSFTATEHHPEAQWILHAFDMKKEAYRDFALRDCNFKGAKANDLEPHSTPLDNATRQPATSQPIITGVGEYITRDGKRVEIRTHHFGDWWRGEIWPSSIHSAWTSAGVHNSKTRNLDIIGPWVEPETEEKPEQWANVFKWPSGIVEIAGSYPSKAAAENNEGAFGENYVGAAFLSHTVGEE